MSIFSTRTRLFTGEHFEFPTSRPVSIYWSATTRCKTAHCHRSEPTNLGHIDAGLDIATIRYRSLEINKAETALCEQWWARKDAMKSMPDDHADQQLEASQDHGRLEQWWLVLGKRQQLAR